MIESAGQNYVKEVLPTFRNEMLKKASENFFTYFFRVEGIPANQPNVPVNFYNDELGHSETVVDRMVARKQTRREFLYILPHKNRTPLDSLVAWIALPQRNLKETIGKIMSLVKENGFFGFIFVENFIFLDNRPYQDFWNRSIHEEFNPYSVLYFDHTLLDSCGTHEIRVVGQKTAPKIIPPPSEPLIDNGWDPYFDYTQYIPAWFWTRCACEFFSTADTISALDAGCGAGPDTKYILSTFSNSRVLGIDSAPDAEKYIVKFLSDGAKKRFDFQCLDLVNYQFPEQTFDLIVSSNVLGFIDKKDAIAIMKKMIISLKPGGVIALTLFGERNEIQGTKSTFTSKEAATIFGDLNVFSLGGRYMLETRKDPAQPQQNIIIVAQKPFN